MDNTIYQNRDGIQAEVDETLSKEKCLLCNGKPDRVVRYNPILKDRYQTNESGAVQVPLCQRCALSNVNFEIIQKCLVDAGYMKDTKGF